MNAARLLRFVRYLLAETLRSIADRVDPYLEVTRGDGGTYVTRVSR